MGKLFTRVPRVTDTGKGAVMPCGRERHVARSLEKCDDLHLPDRCFQATLSTPACSISRYRASQLTFLYTFLPIEHVITPQSIGERSIVMTVSVCLCVFVCPRAYLWKYTSDLYHFCTLPMTVALSSSGGVAIRYILPVLWMTSNLPIS